MLLRGLLASLFTVIPALPGSTADAAAVRRPLADRFLDAANGLVRSTTPTPLSLSRSRGHLAAMSAAPDAVASGLAACPDERTRLAFLEAAVAGDPRAFDPIASEAAAIEMLQAVAPTDRAPRIDAAIRAIVAAPPGTDPTLSTIEAADLTWRPFSWSLDAPVDRLARTSPERRRALLDLETDAFTRPAVIAAVLAAAESPDEFEELLDEADLDGAVSGPAVIDELIRRRASDPLSRLAIGRPEVLAIPAVRIATAIEIARTDPETALRLVGGEANLERFPSIARNAFRASMASGRRHDPDPEAWLMDTALIDQLDDRLVVRFMLERRDAVDGSRGAPDPNRTFEDVSSFRTVTGGRLTSAIDDHLLRADDIVHALGDLIATGRHEVVYSLLAPNSTEPGRPNDQWMPLRVALIGEALADQDASPDAWIPLLEALENLDRLDGQIAGLRAVRESYRRAHGDQDLPEDLRLTLDNTILEMVVD